jgi:hypothetical protein
MIKGKILTVQLLGVALLFAVMAFSVIPALASTSPKSPHNANAIWIEPTTLSFPNTAVGQKFNVTAYINVTDAISTYSLNVTVDPTQLSIIKAGYTHGVESDYFYPMTALSPGAAYGPSSVLIGESLYQSPAPQNQTGVGDLVWVELNITGVPKTEPLSSAINITNPDTWVQRSDFTYPALTRFNASFTELSEFSQPVVLITAIVAASTASVVLTKKLKPKR